MGVLGLHTGNKATRSRAGSRIHRRGRQSEEDSICADGIGSQPLAFNLEPEVLHIPDFGAQSRPELLVVGDHDHPSPESLNGIGGREGLQAKGEGIWA